jgi:hypothetical protein
MLDIKVRQGSAKRPRGVLGPSPSGLRQALARELSSSR